MTLCFSTPQISPGGRLCETLLGIARHKTTKGEGLLNPRPTTALGQIRHVINPQYVLSSARVSTLFSSIHYLDDTLQKVN